MEDNVHMLTLQTQLNSFMDSTLKRVVDEITLLVKHRMEPILDGATVNYAHTHTEHDDLQDLEIQLNCCIDTHLKHVTAEILSYVKDSVAQFVRERADKDSKMKRLEEERQGGHGWGSTDQGTVFLHPATDPLSDLSTAAADDDPGLSEDAEEKAVENQSGEVVAGMACFMVAQPVVDYDLGVVTINLSDANQRHGADPLPDPHPCPEVWATEEVEASQQPTSQGSQEAADPREEDVELSDDLTGLGGDALHRCSQCGKSFSKEWVLHRHLRRHSEGGSGVEGEGAQAGHVCPHCGRGFRQRKGLTSHLLSHGGDRAYTCDVCGQRFKRRESLNKHRRQHTGVKPHGCPHCPRRFYRTDGLKSHLRVHQDHRKLLPGPSRPKHCICTHCGKTFASTAQLTVHERTHTGEQPYECPLCHKRFRYAGGLSGHKLTHQCERTYVCPRCGKGFRCAKHLKRHLVTHSDARPHACSLCVMAFRTANELKAHVLRHGLERTHACPDCGKSFKTDYEVKLHRRTHNGERPYSCDLCPQAFRRPHHLASHRLIHTGERPHACDLCERRFYRSTELQSHKRKVHLREQAHTCDPCQKVFTSLALLEAHRRTSHLAALELPAQVELLAQGLHRYPKILPRCEGEQAASTTSPRPEAAPSLSVPGQVLYQGGPSGGSGGIVFVLTQQPGTLPAPSPAAVLSPIAMATANPTPTTPVHFTVLLPATSNTPATVTLATPQVSNPGTRGRSIRSARNRTSVKQAETQSNTTAQVSTDGSTQDEDGRDKRGRGRGAVGRRGGVGKRGRRATGRGSVTAVSPHTDGPGPAEQPP